MRHLKFNMTHKCFLSGLKISQKPRTREDRFKVFPLIFEINEMLFKLHHFLYGPHCAGSILPCTATTTGQHLPVEYLGTKAWLVRSHDY